MSSVDAAVRELQALAHELEGRGDGQLARRLGQVISSLEAEQGGTKLDLMTTGEAAQALGIRSVNTIKRWAAQGQLDGVRRGGRILVSRASVEKMKGHKSVKQELTLERELDEALDPFDFGDEPVPEFFVSRTGRKPWEQRTGTGSKSPSH